MLLALVFGLPAFLQAQRDSASIALVWANPRSRVYHCPDSEHYGRTVAGAYLREAEARARGFRPRGGRPCAASADASEPRAFMPSAEVSRDTTEARLARVMAAPPPDASPVPPSRMEQCILEEITDGDTIRCRGGSAVRLIGIDSPERDQGPAGLAATAGLAALVPRDATVQLERDVESTDRYGRRLAYVWYRDQMVNWQLVRQGWAVSYPYGGTQRHTAALDAAEARARRERRGLWYVGAFGCRPAEWRRQRC